MISFPTPNERDICTAKILNGIDKQLSFTNHLMSFYICIYIEREGEGEGEGEGERESIRSPDHYGHATPGTLVLARALANKTAIANIIYSSKFSGTMNPPTVWKPPSISS